ncbi:hypothetical protein [Streptomyces flavidovirens]|uniref:hypothetical protein n=1 Tax=Streptomyces flavidovirens TaxID=67298 RepID=UPI00041C859C|nr:hypothetical protein [Streptomyces flavidovirens]
MPHRALLLAVVILASTVVGLVAGILEYASAGKVVTAVKYGGGACGAAVLIGLATATWLMSS